MPLPDIAGSGDPGAMVCPPPGAMLKVIVFRPTRAFASWIAARSVHSVGIEVAQEPLPGDASTPSPVELTTKVAGGGVWVGGPGVGVAVTVGVGVGVSVGEGVGVGVSVSWAATAATDLLTPKPLIRTASTSRLADATTVTTIGAGANNLLYVIAASHWAY